MPQHRHSGCCHLLVLASERDSAPPPRLSEAQQHFSSHYITSHSPFLVITEKNNDTAEALCILDRFKCERFPSESLQAEEAEAAEAQPVGEERQRAEAGNHLLSEG